MSDFILISVYDRLYKAQSTRTVKRRVKYAILIMANKNGIRKLGSIADDQEVIPIEAGMGSIIFDTSLSADRNKKTLEISFPKGNRAAKSLAEQYSDMDLYLRIDHVRGTTLVEQIATLRSVKGSRSVSFDRDNKATLKLTFAGALHFTNYNNESFCNEVDFPSPFPDILTSQGIQTFDSIPSWSLLKKTKI